MNSDLILPQELMREIAMYCDSKTILILRELYPDIITDGFFMDYLIYNGYDVCIKSSLCTGNFIKWTKNGLKHNEFGPAFIYEVGDRYWYINDKCHNENGPAIICSHGDKTWYINNKPHNENGPAIIWADRKEWYINGKLHNENGPAVIWVDGRKEWWINGLLHNENGPAIIYKNGSKEWYINDKKVSEDEFNNRR